MRVAVDLEEVLADTIDEACRSTDKLSLEDFAEWNLDSYVWQVYAGVSDALWRHDPLSIPPVEPQISRHMENIYEQSNKLDIVTARLHVDESIELWLSHHDIPYDEIISTNQPKYGLDYDLYVDDNPSMVGHCNLLLRDHRHNQSVHVSSNPTCNRIHSLAEVPSHM